MSINAWKTIGIRDEGAIDSATAVPLCRTNQLVVVVLVVYRETDQCFGFPITASSGQHCKALSFHPGTVDQK